MQPDLANRMTEEPSVEVPPGFMWGAATSAYQVEGGNTNTDWWEWERRENTPCVEAAGGACDHYQRYPEDIGLLADLGLNTYRFSIEWARVEPTAGKFSAGEIEHYRRVLEQCHERSVRPFPTFHHFTLPRWVAEQGAWEHPDTAELFARYVRTLAGELGDLFDVAVTINEPNMPALLGYELGWFPPGKTSMDARKRATNVLLDAHHAARDALKSSVPHVEVGLAVALTDFQAAPGGEAQLEAIRHLREDVFLDAARGDDFIGVNAYTRHVVGPEGVLEPDAGFELTVMGYEFWPAALEATVRRARDMTGGIPIVVTENGIGTNDDSRRIAYIAGALAGLGRCLADGFDVRGYIYWSLLDNFEWIYGYGPTFGLIEVDRRTFARTVKPSGRWLGAIARRGVVPVGGRAA